MAAAEARAVWQRTANRCFVQEDAKRAPKLACCQSSSSSSKLVDGGPTSAADMPDHPAVGFMPLNSNPSYSNLPPDTRWWLQLQPSYGYQKGLTYEQLNDLEAELEKLRAGSTDSPGKNPKDDTGGAYVDSKLTSEYSLDTDSRISADYITKSSQDYIEYEDTMENSKLMDMDPLGCPKLQKSYEYCFDPESPWIGGEKNLPWWRTDKEDLASLVAQKSLDYIENCDLPPPQKVHVGRYPSAYSGPYDHDEKLTSTLDWKARMGSISSPMIRAKGCCNSESMRGRERASIEGHSQSDSHSSPSYSTTHSGIAQIGAISDNDDCKAQLLEALRHSQTRAREAEKAAKQACAEKDHIIKLFFRQASQLFAYKQWFQMLQLETLYHQMKNSDQPMSTIFPVVLPWMPQKARKPRKNVQKSTKGKRSKRARPRHDLSKYAVAFALGLSLVGAGMLLGWTVGWMLPF